MITKVLDEEGKIVAYLEYWQVGRSGIQKPYGEYMWVQDAWVHEDHRDKGYLRDMVEQALLKHPEIAYGYWRRRKYSSRVSKLMTRERYMKFQMESA